MLFYSMMVKVFSSPHLWYAPSHTLLKRNVCFIHIFSKSKQATSLYSVNNWKNSRLVGTFQDTMYIYLYKYRILYVYIRLSMKFGCLRVNRQKIPSASLPLYFTHCIRVRWVPLLLLHTSWHSEWVLCVLSPLDVLISWCSCRITRKEQLLYLVYYDDYSQSESILIIFTWLSYSHVLFARSWFTASCLWLLK